MKYCIKYWETEDHRDMGESDIHDYSENKDEAINSAKRLFFRQSFPCVEVEENGDTIFHISTEVPNGETY